MAEDALELDEVVEAEGAVGEAGDAGAARVRQRALDLGRDEDGGGGGELQHGARELAHGGEVAVEEEHRHADHLLHARAPGG